MTKDPRVYLAHILECAIRIEEYLREGEGVFMRDTRMILLRHILATIL